MTEENAGQDNPGVPAVTAAARPGPEEKQSSTAGTPGGGLAGALAAGRRMLAGKASAPGSRRPRPGFAKIGAGAAIALVLGILVWWLSASPGGGTGPSAGGEASRAAVEASSAPAGRGALPLAGVSPSDFRVGDCFKDFDPDAAASSVVACDTAHSAQLIAVASYAPTDAYPGRELLRQKALDACKEVPHADKSAGYDLGYKLTYPSTDAWSAGDRRVDCFVAADSGNVIMESLLSAP